MTDDDGNYLINTIPYTTDGLQYNIIPSLGTHTFNPSKRPVFVSPSSTTFNNLDYVDNSSFNVSGYIYYEGTNYPVEGANFYIDGIVCSKNGELIASGDDGYYEISVPIGDHFIQVKKNGHVFADNGRYPADSNNLKTETFKNNITDLYFYDNTKVTIAGRIVGGDIEMDKPLGLGESVNNIGKVEIKLSAGEIYMLNAVKNDMRFTYNTSKKEILSPSNDVNSKSYIKGGSEDYAKEIIIITDSLTGEFALDFLPIEYEVTSIKVLNDDSIHFTTKNLAKIDATNVLVINTDSVMRPDSTYRKFDYCTDFKYTYYSSPVFTVTDAGNRFGAFGESYIEYQDVTMSDPEKVYVYSVDGEGKLNYNLKVNNKAYPVYKQNNIYDFKIKGYEEYINADNQNIDWVPLIGNTVTISNGLSASQKVYVEDGTNSYGENITAGSLVELEDNQLMLDSLGEATYTWMAGLPNIISPFSRNISIILEYGDDKEEWKSDYADGIIIGSLPSGNNFVTSGPDQVHMILRDPPGTNSYAYWETGVSFVHEEIIEAAYIKNKEKSASTDFGFQETVIVGTPGFGVIKEFSAIENVEAGFEINKKTTGSKTSTTTIKTTKRVSTSDDFDFVGAQGDLFIGSATNIIFGNCRQVGLEKSGNDYNIVTRDAISTGYEFSTGFNYTTNFIENSLIPNLHKIRNSLLQTVSQSEYDSFINEGDEIIYITTLTSDDERFGSRNFDEGVWGNKANKDKALTSGPSYKIVLPQILDTKKAYQDMVLWYNEQITGWENTLAFNEESKIKAIENHFKYLDQNYSFDSGAAIESSTSTCENDSYKLDFEIETLLITGIKTGTTILNQEISLTAKTTRGLKVNISDSQSTESCITTGYSFKEEGDDDALTVDVYEAPDHFGAIFRTRGGQTSCPYEGEIVSKYHRPGFVLSEATMQIEMPVLTVVNPFAVDVPSGKSATYTLKLENISEIDEDVWFDLAMLDETNPDGAKITMDGAILTDGRNILVRAGETLTKTLNLTQTRPDIMNYENISIVLKSMCQADPTAVNAVLADTVSLYAYFVPSSSDITLQIADRIMNTYTSDTIALQIKDFDRNFNNLKAIRIQYKGERDIEWSLAKEYLLYDIPGSKSELLPDGGIITYKFPMSNKALFPDQTYTFRAVTATLYGNDEIINESEHIDVIKDMAIPWFWEDQVLQMVSLRMTVRYH